ncbi:MAG: DUF7009 family protein [Rhodothermales bacterium]
MKVRLTAEMIRFRLERDEVDRLAAGRAVVLSLDIPPTDVTVVLEPVHRSGPIANSRGGVRIGIPAAWLTDWPTSDVVGFDFDLSSMDSLDENVIRIVVEKDFPCSHDGLKPPKPVRMS